MKVSAHLVIRHRPQVRRVETPMINEAGPPTIRWQIFPYPRWSIRIPHWMRRSIIVRNSCRTFSGNFNYNGRITCSWRISCGFSRSNREKWMARWRYQRQTRCQWSWCAGRLLFCFFSLMMNIAFLLRWIEDVQLTIFAIYFIVIKSRNLLKDFDSLKKAARHGRAQTARRCEAEDVDDFSCRVYWRNMTTMKQRRKQEQANLQRG